MNWTESKLLSWRPRRASSRLKHRLFAGNHHPHAARWIWGCLAPSTACVLLTLMAVNNSNDALGPKPGLSLALSNLTSTIVTTDERLSAQNHLCTVTFDSTNRSIFNSNTRFTPPNNFSNK